MTGYSTGNFDKDWNTPPDIIESVKRMFNGTIELDPCSNPYSMVPAIEKIILPLDGLKQEWNRKTIYVNPPYGRDKERKTSIKDWFKKIVETREKFNNEILVLVPVSTNTQHWKEYVFPKANAICFLHAPRLKFWQGGQENKKGAPMACCVIYYGNDTESFSRCFSAHGNIVKL